MNILITGGAGYIGSTLAPRLLAAGHRVRVLAGLLLRRDLINARMYLLEPGVQRFIPDGRRFDMTDLVQRLLGEGRPVASFPIVEFWLDVGQPIDYERVQDDMRSGWFAQ